MANPSKKMTWIIAIVLLAIVVPLAAIALLVDDWSRDLTTNVAETSTTAADPLLRPLTTTATAAEIDQAARAVADTADNWEYVESTLTGPRPIIRLVHQSKLLKFRDDVTLTITESPDGESTIHIRSASRIGKGDLGQNPRNIRDLHQRLAQRL